MIQIKSWVFQPGTRKRGSDTSKTIFDLEVFNLGYIVNDLKPVFSTKNAVFFIVIGGSQVQYCLCSLFKNSTHGCLAPTLRTQPAMHMFPRTGKLILSGTDLHKPFPNREGTPMQTSNVNMGVKPCTRS